MSCAINKLNLACFSHIKILWSSDFTSDFPFLYGPDRISMKSEIGKYVGYVEKYTHRMIELKESSLLLIYV